LIVEETTRCSAIVKGLLEFSRQTPPAKNMSDINDVIEKTLLLFESQILLANVKIEKQLDRKLPMVMMDANKIKQVLTNIILNAIDAMPHGGSLSIISRLSEENQFVELTFKDTGCGIPEENLSKIFDPFFSTKGTKGTGLGLSVSYGIVQQHNGTINIQSEVGKGTAVIVSLPVKEKKT
jgi:two-component system NtrC family sensor kinase